LQDGSAKQFTQRVRATAVDRGLVIVGMAGSKVAIFVCVAVLYFFASRLALMMKLEAENVAALWPASGIAAGAAVALGRRHIWPILAAVMVATAVANLTDRSSLAAIAVFSFCNAIECALFAWSMRAVDRSRAQLESIASVIAFLSAAILAPALTAIPASVAMLSLGLSPASFFEIWLSWAKSDAVGIVAVAPMMITAPALARSPPRPAAVAEGALGTLVTTAVAIYAFSRTLTGGLSIPTPATILFPLFVWLALRSPPFFAALSAFCISLVIVFLTLAGDGRFGDPGADTALRLAAAQAGIVTATGALLTLSAMFTRLKNYAAALAQSEQSLQLALQAGRMYAFEHDIAAGHVRRVGGLYTRLGLPELGTRQDYLARLHPEDLEAFEDVEARLSPAEPSLQRLLRLRAANGDELSIEYRTQGEFDERGNLVRIRGTCVDVTELARTREALEVQARQLSGALRAGRVFAFEYDHATGSVRRSDNASEILGISPEQSRSGRNIFVDLVHPDDREALLAYGTRHSDDTGFRHRRFRFIRPDGVLAWLEITSTASFDPNGHLRKIQGLARDVSEQLRAERRQVQLVNELNHRVKNSLARMKVVLELSREQHQTVEDFIKAVEGRIRSMARTQEKLSASRWEGIGIEEVVGDELAPYAKGGNCRVEGPAHLLEPDAAQGFAFTLHELATNAAKHGALAHPGGQVDVRWTVETAAGAPQLCLTWRETSPVEVKPPSRSGFGLTQIREVLSHEQDADVNVAFPPTGLVYTIRMPLADHASKP
jgi:PAS domain S-box-containing protein